MKQITTLLILLLLVACGGAAEPELTATEAVAPTPTTAEVVEPTPTVAVIVEPTATEVVAIEPTAEVEVVEPTAAVVVEDVAEVEDEPVVEVVEEAAATTTFQLEAWGDNWFAAYLGEELIVEDSVSITTERSFNSETATFEASYPLQLNFILKDFIENDTGLEYIGSNRQQMGDGGFIMQLTDLGSGEVVAVSNGEWACTVIHEAPLDKSCESEANPVAGVAPCEFSISDEPAGWMSAEYDDSAWTATTVHSAASVDPKQGYNDILWDSSAEFIWGPDLETNNTILCRVTVTGE